MREISPFGWAAPIRHLLLRNSNLKYLGEESPLQQKNQSSNRTLPAQH
jgi:hypothetical protein